MFVVNKLYKICFSKCYWNTVVIRFQIPFFSFAIFVILLLNRKKFNESTNSRRRKRSKWKKLYKVGGSKTLKEIHSYFSSAPNPRYPVLTFNRPILVPSRNYVRYVVTPSTAQSNMLQISLPPPTLIAHRYPVMRYQPPKLIFPTETNPPLPISHTMAAQNAITRVPAVDWIRNTNYSVQEKIATVNVANSEATGSIWMSQNPFNFQKLLPDFKRQNPASNCKSLARYTTSSKEELFKWAIFLRRRHFVNTNEVLDDSQLCADMADAGIVPDYTSFKIYYARELKNFVDRHEAAKEN